jgi:hypothetical protein
MLATTATALVKFGGFLCAFEKTWQFRHVYPTICLLVTVIKLQGRFRLTLVQYTYIEVYSAFLTFVSLCLLCEPL